MRLSSWSVAIVLAMAFSYSAPQEMLSENPSQPRTQATHPDHDISTDSFGRSIIATGISFAEQQTKQKPRFAEFMCSYAEVFRFAVVVTKAVIPTAFWGSQKNFKLVTNCECCSPTYMESS